MAQYLRFPTVAGGAILVEVEEKEEKIAGMVKAGLGEKVQKTVIEVQDTFEATMMETVRRNAEAFVRTMLALPVPPDEALLSFGVNAVAEAGCTAIAKVSGEASYLVTLTWKQEDNGRKVRKEPAEQ